MSAQAMTLQPVVTPTRPDGLFAGQARLTGQLLQAFAQALLNGVQQTTDLNWRAAKSLLQFARAGDAETRADSAQQSWQFSWRSVQVCATTAAELLELGQVHAHAAQDELWREIERLLGREGAGFGLLDARQAALLRDSIGDMREAQTTYLRAAMAAHGDLLRLAENASAHEAAS